MADLMTENESDSQNEAPENSDELSEPTPLEGEELQAALDNALAEVAALKDQTLRAKAETENMRKRVSRDVEKAHKFALEKFASNLLPVVDSLEKAIESIDTESPDSQGAQIESMGDGVKLALKLFLDTLERSGVKPVFPEGEPFDPQFHEAMGMLESPDVEPGSVVAVLQKGYTLNDRLVRAAMVMVSKDMSKDVNQSTNKD
ncbi:MAG: nucleotide exchange factor GrpE [Pseudomonadales bacterium]|nr:nucleotide exchange factor GrpE [Pseudomonadales bacterium]